MAQTVAGRSGSAGTLGAMAPHSIRIIGDPVLKQVAKPVEAIDGRLARIVEDMLETMYEAPGLGLAAPQVGIQRRFFVYDYGEGPSVMINPEIRESSGEWVYEEGCLSVPGLHWEIVRPKEILIVGLDLDGNEVQIEADELESRLYQHELDHLDGVLLVEHLTDEQRREAKKALRQLAGRQVAKEVVGDTGGKLGLRLS
jgi:peptide deformylase